MHHLGLRCSLQSSAPRRIGAIGSLAGKVSSSASSSSSSPSGSSSGGGAFGAGTSTSLRRFRPRDMRLGEQKYDAGGGGKRCQRPTGRRDAEGGQQRRAPGRQHAADQGDGDHA